MTTIPPLRLDTSGLDVPRWARPLFAGILEWGDRVRRSLIPVHRERIKRIDSFVPAALPLRVDLGTDDRPSGVVLMECRRVDGTLETSPRVITDWTFTSDAPVQLEIQGISNLTADKKYTALIFAIWSN